MRCTAVFCSQRGVHSGTDIEGHWLGNNLFRGLHIRFAAGKKAGADVVLVGSVAGGCNGSWVPAQVAGCSMCLWQECALACWALWHLQLHARLCALISKRGSCA